MWNMYILKYVENIVQVKRGFSYITLAVQLYYTDLLYIKFSNIVFYIKS